MTPTEQDLARELARHPAWKWGSGMLAVWGNRLERVVLAADDGRGLLCGTDATSPEHYPDLSDPATQGCLWAMLREATGDEGASAGYARDGWSCDPFGIETEPPGWRAFWSTEREPFGNIDVNCATLGEALARAWLAVVNHD